MLLLRESHGPYGEFRMNKQSSDKAKKIKSGLTLAAYLWLAPHMVFSYQHTSEFVERGNYTDRHEFSVQFERKQSDEVGNDRTH